MIALKVPAYRVGNPLCAHYYEDISGYPLGFEMLTCIHCGREIAERNFA